jgi:hypothetical protein
MFQALRRAWLWFAPILILNPLASADTSASEFAKWWPQFQSAVAKRDAKAVAQSARFPLNWENGPVREIKTDAELVSRFDFYFTAEIRKMVAGRKPERLPNGVYIITWKARGNEYSLYFRPGDSGGFLLDGLSEGPP